MSGMTRTTPNGRCAMPGQLPSFVFYVAAFTCTRRILLAKRAHTSILNVHVFASISQRLRVIYSSCRSGRQKDTSTMLFYFRRAARFGCIPALPGTPIFRVEIKVHHKAGKGEKNRAAPKKERKMGARGRREFA